MTTHRAAGPPGARPIRIGTSGWHYAHWKGRVYPEGMNARDYLTAYAGRFRTVEINNTFYRLPEPGTFDAWARSVPAGFLFAVKVNRFITHNKKLRDPREFMGRFLERVSRLGRRLGPLLVQLPPGWKADPERLDAFLAAVPRRFRCALEFRNPTWFDPRVYEVLRRRRAALCIYDLQGRTTPVEVTAGFVYVRFHGPDAPYAGDYPREVLAAWAERIRRWSASGLEVFCYFNNDVNGHAVSNAETLAALTSGSAGRAAGRDRAAGEGPS